VPPASAPFVQPAPGPVISSPTPGGMAAAKPNGFEKDYGHVL